MFSRLFRYEFPRGHVSLSAPIHLFVSPDEYHCHGRRNGAAAAGEDCFSEGINRCVEETGIASPETKARAQLIKEVSDNEDRLELLLESKRIAAVVRLQDELHPPADCEDCPICLDRIKHVNPKTICRSGCCGGWICKQCDNARYKDAKEGLGKRYHGKCPLCRGKIPSCYEEIRSMVLEHANNGRAWAQADMARWYLSGMNGFADRVKGLQFIKLAADQRYADALLQMAMAYNV